MRVGAEIVTAVAERLAKHAGLELPAWVIEARVAARIETLEVTPVAYPALIQSSRSADALALAQTGRYRASALADVPEEFRDDFIADGDHVRIRPELAQLVRFDRANLVDGATPKGCDLVWCRNVLIYFTPDARRRAI